jgi:hypothetical protein
MVAALIAYQEQHQEQRYKWQKDNNLECTCRACQYAREVKIEATMPAPIFIPPSLPWAEETTS